MNCPNCGAPMKLILAKRQYVCNHCTTSYFPEENRDGVQTLGEQSHGLCPICGYSPLIFATSGGKTVLHCKECRGLLVQIRELMPIIQTLRSQRLANSEVVPPLVDHGESSRKVSCPVCKRVMDTYLYGGGGNVYVDSCIECGVIWLDYRELNRIVEAPTRSRPVPYRTLWEQQGEKSYSENVDLWSNPSVLTSSLNTILDLLF